MAAYVQQGLVLRRGLAADPAVVRALQQDLRALGYLRGGVDGQFGDGTDAAIRALQYDLLHNDGSSSEGDGNAPVAIRSFNPAPPQPAVTEVNGVMDQVLAGCIAALMTDSRVCQLPSHDNPASQNAAALAMIVGSSGGVAPGPFIAAIVQQESGGQHYRVPAGADKDSYIVVGLDHNASDRPEQVTSRGYGIGQYTIFHHPPRPEEVTDFMLDPLRNVQKAQAELRAKFDKFLVGPSDTADDRKAEHPILPLRLCRYASTDPRYLRDCVRCAQAVPTTSITTGTPFFAGAQGSFQPTQYYKSCDYAGVPLRAAFLCDWPYAVRRYNGSGVDSFHYQARVLLNLVHLNPP